MNFHDSGFGTFTLDKLTHHQKKKHGMILDKGGTKAEIEFSCWPFNEFYDEMGMEYKSALAEILQVIASALRNGKDCFIETYFEFVICNFL